MKSKGVEITPFFCNGIQSRTNPLAARLCNRNFHPLEIVPRYREPQFQEGENYSRSFNFVQYFAVTSYWARIADPRPVIWYADPNVFQRALSPLATKGSMAARSLTWMPRKCPRAPDASSRLVIGGGWGLFLLRVLSFFVLADPADWPGSARVTASPSLPGINCCLTDVNRNPDVIMPYTAPDFLPRGWFCEFNAAF